MITVYFIDMFIIIFFYSIANWWLSGFYQTCWITGLLNYWITGILFAGRLLLWHFQQVNLSFLFLLIVLLNQGFGRPWHLHQGSRRPLTLSQWRKMFVVHILKTNHWGGIFNVYCSKLFHSLITLKLKKFLLISRLHSFELRFILHVENLVFLSCVYRPCKPCTFFYIIMFMENLSSLD